MELVTFLCSFHWYGESEVYLGKHHVAEKVQYVPSIETNLVSYCVSMKLLLERTMCVGACFASLWMTSVLNL